jgi:hypothetical protein
MTGKRIWYLHSFRNPHNCRSHHASLSLPWSGLVLGRLGVGKNRNLDGETLVRVLNANDYEVMYLHNFHSLEMKLLV